MFIHPEEVRTYLQLGSNDSSKDAIIALILPSIIAELASQCGMNDRVTYLTSSSISFHEDQINISGIDFVAKGFNDKMEIVVTGSNANDGIYSIKVARPEFLQVLMPEPATFVEEEAKWQVRIQKITIPLALKNTGLAMAAYRTNEKIAQGLTSERIGDWSASFSSEYPKSITDQIVKYRKLRW